MPVPSCIPLSEHKYHLPAEQKNAAEWSLGYLALHTDFPTHNRHHLYHTDRSDCLTLPDAYTAYSYQTEKHRRVLSHRKPAEKQSGHQKTNPNDSSYPMHRP